MWPDQISNPGLWLMSQMQLLGLQAEIVGSEAQLRGINSKAKTPFGFSECSRVKAVCVWEGVGWQWLERERGYCVWARG